MKIRFARIDDLADLVELRMQLFQELGEINDIKPNADLRDATARHFAQSFEDHRTVSWLAEDQDRKIGCGSIVEFVRPPYAGNLTGREAYLLNMYIVPDRRRQGVAKQLLDAMLEYAEQEGYGKVWLNASQDGKPLYERVGFKQVLTVFERPAIQQESEP